MECLECKVTIDRHNEINYDIKELSDIQKDLTNGRIMMAIEGIDCFIAKLRHRNNNLTGR